MDLPEKLSQPAQRALAAIGVSSLEDLSKHSKSQILNLHGFGPSGMRLLESSMKSAGIQFAPKEAKP